MREEKRTRPGGRTVQALAEIATGQHGVVAANQLAAIGHSKAKVSREVRAGRLHRIHRGVYSVGHQAISRSGQCMAAVLACGDEIVLSHCSAAWLWGLTSWWAEIVEVTAASARHARDGIRTHSSTRLRDADREEIDNIPVTAVPRTLLDFAATRHRSLEAAIQRAERLDLLDLIEIDALLARNPGSRGAERLRDSLVAYRDPAFTRSSLERRFLQLVKEAGLPRPSMNFFVDGHELDAYWPDERFAVELDTYEYHGGRRAFEVDRIRHENLKLSGIEMVRVTGARIDRDPDEVADRLRKLLMQRRRGLLRTS